MRKWLAKVATSRDAYLDKQRKVSSTFSGGVFASEEVLGHVKIEGRLSSEVNGQKKGGAAKVAVGLWKSHQLVLCRNYQDGRQRFLI